MHIFYLMRIMITSAVSQYLHGILNTTVIKAKSFHTFMLAAPICELSLLFLLLNTIHTGA